MARTVITMPATAKRGDITRSRGVPIAGGTGGWELVEEDRMGLARIRTPQDGEVRVLRLAI